MKWLTKAMYVNTENGQMMSVCAIFISTLGMGDYRKIYTHNYSRISIMMNITKNFEVTYAIPTKGLMPTDMSNICSITKSS